MTEGLPIVADRLPGADGKPGTGLRAAEAVELAAKWWDDYGRGAAWKRFNEEQVGRRVNLSTGTGPMLIRKGDMEPVVPQSGILNGTRWLDLPKADRLQITKVWYAEVWGPQQRAEKPRPIDQQADKPTTTDRVPLPDGRTGS